MLAAMLWLGFFAWGLANGSEATSTRALTHESTHEAGQTGAAPLLLPLLRGLQSEAETDVRRATATVQWCKGAQAQQSSMIEVLQRQMDEASTAVRQVALDEKRLKSEQNLASSTGQEKEQQLRDASSTTNFALSEFANEQKQMERTMEAAAKVLHLVRLERQGGHRPSSTNAKSELADSLAQLPQDRMSDTEKGVIFMHARDTRSPEGGGAAGGSEELFQTLNELHKRLGQDHADGVREQLLMLQKLMTFADHLNSSIMETRSQLAAIDMEAAQRRREHMRQEGKISDLSALLKVVRVSKAATDAACSEEEKGRAEVAKYAAAESHIVKAILKQLPTSSSYLLGDSPQPTSLSFLQARKSEPHAAVLKVVDDLQNLAEHFPQEAVLYADGARELSPHEVDATSTMARQSVATERDAAVDAPAESDRSATAALQDIKQFVEMNSNAVDHTDQVKGSKDQDVLVNELDKSNTVQGAHAGLSRVHEKERAVSDQQNWCASLLRDANVDSAALARSLTRFDAKLKTVKVAILEYTQGSAYYQKQHDLTGVQLEQFNKLVEEQNQQLQASQDVLNTCSKQLMSLIAEQDQDPSAEGQTNAQLVKDLLQNVMSHRNALQHWHEGSRQRHSALEAADRVVQHLFAQILKHNKRRLARLNAEAQYLNSLTHAKKSDQVLSQRFLEVSDAICSQDRLRERGRKAHEH